MKNLSEVIINALKSQNRISDQDIQKALTVYASEGKVKLRDVLVRMDLITEKELSSLLGAALKIPYLNLSKLRISAEVGKLIPEKLARRHHIIPVSKIGNVLTLAMADPLNIFAVDDIAIITKNKVECVISTEKDIAQALDRLYMNEFEQFPDSLPGPAGADSEIKVIKNESDLDAAHDVSDKLAAPVVKMSDLLLREALRRRASDIHIEPFENEVRVRYRVDGNLQQALSIPKKSQNALLSRLKIMARLDITENRVPQDGRFKIRLPEKEVDFRVSVLPVQFGSKVVMRILDKSSLSTGLDNLGFFSDTLADFKTAINKPFGIILITGPTGSGKSTTLYSILNQLNTPDKNIITIEDPIEYQVSGITQIQANPEIGFDFASGLRAILRQSPDVVMVGEIRDAETADIAIKASLTGQLVLSTLHTNDAAGAVTRLMDMNIEPFLIASSLVLVAAQRLCRKVCEHCRQKIEIPDEVFARLNIRPEEIEADAAKRNFQKGKGCAKCGQTGYKGRLGVLETLGVDDTMRELIIKKSSALEIKEYAISRGSTTLRKDALRKFFLGLTTLDEVLRITSDDE